MCVKHWGQCFGKRLETCSVTPPLTVSLSMISNPQVDAKQCSLTFKSSVSGSLHLMMLTWLFPYTNKLTHWDRHKMVTANFLTFSNAFSWMKIYKYRLRFRWSLFPMVRLTTFQYWFRWRLGAVQATSHYLNTMVVSLLTHISATQHQRIWG